MAEPAPQADSPGSGPRRVILIDGSGYIFRAFHAQPPMTREDGTPVNAVFGFANMLLKLLNESQTDYLAVVFDTARKTFRTEIYDQYKANRPEPPPELVPQFALIREATRAFGLPVVELDGFEADDLIATYARAAAADGAEVTIVSSDKDLMQLVGDGITMLDPIKNRPIGPAEVMERFGVGPEKVVDVQALSGDATDNVPGVPGIGVKTAAELIRTYGDLETLLIHAGEIKQPKRRETLLQNADKARMSKELVRLKDDVPVPVPLEDMRVGPRDTDKLLAYLDLNGFRSIANRVRQGAGAAPASSPAAAPAPTPGGAAPTAAPVDMAAAKDDYVLVQDLAALWQWIEGATAQGLVAVDTETTSLDAMRAELVGVSLALAPGKACYIPLGHVPPGGALGLDGPVPQQIPLDDALAALRPLLADRSVLKVGHNIKYDIEVLRRYDAPVTPFDDTMLLSYVLEAGLHGHGLDELAQLHLGRNNIKYGDVTGTGKSQIGFAEVPLPAALDYAAEDADVSLRLHALFKPRLLEQRLVTVYETLERPLVPVLVAMECAGIKVDANELRRLSQDFEGRIAQIAEEVHRLAGHPFNIGSPKQLGEVLFDEMSLPGGKKGKTGAYATGADVLEDLAAMGHDLPARVLDWRQLSKLKSTYTDALIGTINPATGRVHTSYAQAIASTGRLSSNEPNLQNIPIRTEEGRKIRKAFVADDGCVLLSADYSQIELRLLAHVAGIQTLKDAFKRGADIHAMTASEVFGVPVEGMDPSVRNRAKAINFGIVYGISAFGLARQLGIPQADAARFIKTYFEHYPGIRDYVETMRAFARAHGYVTTIFGRRVHMPGINDKNPTRRNFFERAAINAPLQGAAADIIKRAMVRMPDALAAKKLSATMLLQVHDELVFEVPEAEAEETAAVVKTVMSGVAQLSVPLVVETGTAKTWADAH